LSAREIDTAGSLANGKRDLANRMLRQRTGRPAVPSDATRPAELIDVPEAYFRFEKHPAYLKLLGRVDELHNAGTEVPFFRLHQITGGSTTRIAERDCISFSHYDYLGLSGHPTLKKAIIGAIDRYGTSVSASRLVGGERPLHAELEDAIADKLETEACLAFISGYGTNVATIAHLFGPRDLILHDALAHNSIQTGVLLSGARRMPFRHNDWEMADKLLRRHRAQYERVLIVIEGLYSMDGDFPDLPHFVELRNRYKALLMVDEAHSFGVMGQSGGGLREHFGLAGSDVDIWMGTLSKAFASSGGYIAGSRALVTNMKFNASGFVFSVGLAPANAAAALAALQVMNAESERVHTLHQRARFFLDLMQERGLPTGLSRGVAIIPLVVGNTVRCVKLTNALLKRGIDVQPILRPGVKERSVRLRFFVNSKHSEAQLRQAAEIIDKEYQAVS
jgi:8-amino-7-oxononanoate synthase